MSTLCTLAEVWDGDEFRSWGPAFVLLKRAMRPGCRLEGKRYARHLLSNVELRAAADALCRLTPLRSVDDDQQADALLAFMRVQITGEDTPPLPDDEEQPYRTPLLSSIARRND